MKKISFLVLILSFLHLAGASTPDKFDTFIKTSSVQQWGGKGTWDGKGAVFNIYKAQTDKDEPVLILAVLKEEVAMSRGAIKLYSVLFVHLISNDILMQDDFIDRDKNGIINFFNDLLSTNNSSESSLKISPLDMATKALIIHHDIREK